MVYSIFVIPNYNYNISSYEFNPNNPSSRHLDAVGPPATEVWLSSVVLPQINVLVR